MNVLKPHQKGAVVTLLQNEVSQHEISRKTVRKLALAMAAARWGEGSNSPMATGSESLPGQISPPRPPAPGTRSPPVGLPAHARSACEGHREWIEAQVRLDRNAMAIYQELVDRFGRSVLLLHLQQGARMGLYRSTESMRRREGVHRARPRCVHRGRDLQGRVGRRRLNYARRDGPGIPDGATPR